MVEKKRQEEWMGFKLMPDCLHWCRHFVFSFQLWYRGFYHSMMGCLLDCFDWESYYCTVHWLMLTCWVMCHHALQEKSYKSWLI